MKKLRNKINEKLLSAKLAMERMLKEERGDTNFISIAIILIVVIVIAVIFIGFGDEIGQRFTKSTSSLLNTLP